jgi:hypothetical protein
MSASPPLIFLAFANDQSNYLYNLSVERDQIRAALQPAVDQGLCELIIEPSATIGTILDVFQRHRHRIAVFHYGGHADAYQMLLETDSGERSLAHSGGLSSFLAEQQGLEMVFFNGCSSESQAKELAQAGVSVVVGTTQPISDAVAMRLSQLFYQYLATGLSLGRAWEKASEEVKTVKAGSGYRSLDWGQKDALAEETYTFPWRLHLREGADKALAWSLPEAAGKPLFDLPLPRTYYEQLPVSPYKGLQYFQREDAAVFFGRGVQIRALYQQLELPESVILFYGKSGAGKSSLLDAGLLPRLEGSWQSLYQRRRPDLGLSGSLLTALRERATALGLDASAGRSPRALWAAIEATQKQPLLFILDQAEECFTRPRPLAEAPELPQWLSLLGELFAEGADAPQGKLILAYRKEYHPELKQAFQEQQLPTAELFLQHLDRAGIVEVIEGLPQQPDTRETYQLQIPPEPGGALADIIADDLLEDRDSPMAAMLQILLTKMWREAKQEDSTRPTFSVALYQRIKKEGLAMGEFFDQQMEKLVAWRPELVDSGLVLDLLHFHTTPLGTAGTRSLAEIREQYRTRQGQIEELMVKCKELYLLNTPQQQSEHTSLAHDTLAPVVIDRFNASDRPGQRALRILTNKLKDFEAGNDKTYLDAADLAVLEAGIQGMRHLRSQAEALLAASRELQAQRKKEQQRNRWMVGALTVFIAILGMVGVGQYRSTQRAELSTIDNLIRASWKAGLYLERRQDYVEGVRKLYEGVKPIMNLGQLQELSPVAIFDSSPHTDAPNYESSAEFTYYNEDFVIWLREYGIPGAKDEAFRAETQAVYDDFLQDMAQAYYKVYFYLENHPNLAAYQREYVQLTTAQVPAEQIPFTQDHFTTAWGTREANYRPQTAVDYLHWRFSTYSNAFGQDPKNGGIGSYYADVACGFWLRRHIDGTSEEFFDLLVLLLQTYDPDFLVQY